MTPSSRRRGAARIPGRARPFAIPCLALGLLCVSSAHAVGQPSTYPGCATREVSVAWGGAITIDLSACHAFGLGVVSQAPVHGGVTPGDSEPVDSYRYSHQGAGPAGGGRDRFVVLDDNSDLITVNVTIQAPASALAMAPAELPPMQAGAEVRHTFLVAGGTAPYTFRLSAGALPKGLRLDPAGVLTGIATERGAFGFSLRAQDARSASVEQSFAGAVQPAALAISPTRAIARPGVLFTQALAVAGGVPPYRFLLEPAPGLPAGIDVSGTGVVSAAASVAPGRYPLTVRVTDSSTGPGEHFELEGFVLDVGAAPTVSITVAPAAVTEDGADPLVYTVTRSERLGTATVVGLARSGTLKFEAGAGAVPASVTIPAGATSTRVVVDPSADRTVEPDETAVFTVVPGDGYVVGAPASATGTVLDDDTP